MHPASRLTVIARTLAVCLAAAVTVHAAGPSPAAPSLKQVLARAGDYSVSYGAALASVIADETFTQEIVLSRDGTTGQRRLLESEIAFVKLAGTIEWLAFRSVLRVDGASVPGGSGRLERLMRDAPQSALSQARAISDEGARHHLGPVQRNFNVPTTVLQFILPQHQDRFRFRKAGEERVDGELAWIVEFQERDRATFIRTPDGRAAPSRGSLSVVPDDGRVLASRLEVKAVIEAGVEVRWRRDDRLALWVPAEMRERYRGRELVLTDAAGKDEPFELRGLATYTNYRRFEVDFRLVR